ncbi:uncharacterized protein [Argopecten irradians]|uniref:uncharacterized protein n=1 Tax=Argopecten irradians TaxID=31199 RepID=UPI003713429D
MATTNDEKDSFFLYSKLRGSYRLLKTGLKVMLNTVVPAIKLFLLVSDTIDFPNDIKILGSTGEGFILSNLGSSSYDIDIMIISNRGMVYEDRINDVPETTWVFQMNPCPKNSGYVRLKQIVKGDPDFLEPFKNRNELFRYDRASGCWFTNAFKWQGDSDFIISLHNTLIGLSEIRREEFFNSGPCKTTNRTFTSLSGEVKYASIDLLVGIWCREWPSVATEWVKRNRKFGWPSQEFIDKHVKKGCYVVPVGCKECKQTDLDWRLSFAHVEVDLVHEMNENHVNCFVSLRWLKKCYFEEEMPNVITSYIIKTTLFWTIEETCQDIWQSQQLLTTVNLCLDRLVSFVQKDFCPNYFIRDCNLLTGRYIPADKGKVLAMCKEARRSLIEILSPKQLPYKVLLQETLNGNIVFKEKILTRLFLNYMASTLMKSLFSDIHIKTKFRVLEKSLQEIISIAFNGCEGLNEEIEMIRNLATNYQERFLMINKPDSVWDDHVDVKDVNSIANICHVKMINGNLDTCISILKRFLSDQKRRKYRRLPQVDIGLSLKSPSVEALSAMNIFICDGRKPISNFVLLDQEKNTLPDPLKMEFYSRGIHITQLNTTPVCFRYIVEVDPLVYVCFLRFWCSMKLDENIEKLRARTDMVWCCGLDNIQEKAVAFSLLAYCHTQLEEYDKAFTALCRAMRKKSARPSTLVNIAILINKLISLNKEKGLCGITM